MGFGVGQLLQLSATAQDEKSTWFDSIETREIKLIGRDGKIRAIFYAADDPNLILFDRDGNNRLNFGLAPAGTGGIEIIGLDDTKWTSP